MHIDIVYLLSNLLISSGLSSTVPPPSKIIKLNELSGIFNNCKSRLKLDTIEGFAIRVISSVYASR